MPGPEDKTGDFWKDQDVNPEQCGSCASKNITLNGDFFECKACGFQWAKREEPKEAVPSTDEIVGLLIKHLVVNAGITFPGEEAKKVQAWINHHLKE